ncbi:MAG TPA: hypothetical protein VFD60_09710 [Nitrososphaeraceae archaeon]|nr:hypothetical protein [Nitrososphaeraceae archaeon]
MRQECYNWPLLNMGKENNNLNKEMTFSFSSAGIFFTILTILLLSTSLVVTTTFTTNKAFAQTSLSSLLSSSNGNANNNNIPNAKVLYETGTMSLPTSVKGFIINLPDETHELDTANKTISHQNAHYLPTNLAIPSGTAIAFIHGDPNHTHIESVTDTSTGEVVWQTIPVKHPGASDVKILAPGSYNVSDLKYPSMKGTITVKSNPKSTGSLVLGGFFCPTPSLTKYKSDFTTAGFQVLSTYDFLSKTKQRDISGPTTLLVYSTTLPMQDALTKLMPLLGSLPYL